MFPPYCFGGKLPCGVVRRAGSYEASLRDSTFRRFRLALGDLCVYSVRADPVMCGVKRSLVDSFTFPAS